MAIRYIIIALVVYLGSFVLVMLFGLQGIGQMANWAGPIMLVYFVWLVIWLLTRAEFQPNIPKLWVSKVGLPRACRSSPTSRCRPTGGQRWR